MKAIPKVTLASALAWLLFNVSVLTAKGTTGKSEDAMVRDRRDSYGGGYGGYGGGGGGYGGGGYGCSCPSTQCNKDNTDDLLAFGIGALLGLLLAMLRGGMMMMMMAAAPPPPMMGGRSALEDSLHNVTWKVDAKEDVAFQPGRRSSLVQLLHLPENMGDELAPVVTNLLQIYTRGSKKPECLRRWICESTQLLHRNGGLQARLGSLSSIAFGWYTKDMVPILQNVLPGTKEVDCRLLSPRCDAPFQSND